MKNTFLKLTALLILICACNKVREVITPQQTAKKVDTKKLRDNEVIVTFKNGKPDDLTAIGGSVKEKVYDKTMQYFHAVPFYVLNVPDVSKAIEALKHNPNVRSVSASPVISIPEPDFKTSTFNNVSLNTKLMSVQNRFSVPTSSSNIIQINALRTSIEINKRKQQIKSLGLSANSSSKSTARTLATYPNDTLFVAGAQWGLSNINAPAAWPTNKGSQKVYIGNIDEGADYGHPDLCGQIDYHHSYDFYNGDSTIFDFSDEHGTATTSEYGANTNNGIGIAGVCPNLTIFVAKFLQQSGSTAAAIQAIDFITNLKISNGYDVLATNNSWGYSGDRIQELFDAIDRARQAGILFNAAAGNSGTDNNTQPFYPANFSTELDNVISVGALDQNSNPASFSNFGSTTVNIFAPGVAIWSAGYNADGTPMYWNPSGTSMATPHITGAEALYKAGHPTATYLEVKNAVLSHARPLAVLTGKCTTGGALDVSSFTQGSTDVPVNRTDCALPVIDTTTPNKVQNVRVTGTTTSSITFAWDTTAHAYFYGLLIRQQNAPDAQYSTFGNSLILGGLPTGDTVTVFVYAVSKIGRLSPPSDPCTGVTQGPHDSQPPTVPTNYHVQSMTPNGSNVDVTLAWDASSDNDQILGYYGEGQDNQPNPQHWSFGFYSGYKDSHGNLILAITIPAMPPNDTFVTHLQSIDRTWNRSAFCDTIRFITNGTILPPPPQKPVISSFSASPSTIDSGQNSTLSWSVTGADNISIDNGIGTVTGTSVNVSPSQTTAYNLTATNSAGSVNASATVTVNKPIPPPPPPADSVSVTLTGSVGLAGLHILNWTITGKPDTITLQELVNGSWIDRQSGGTSYSYTQKGKKPRTFHVVAANGANTATSNTVTLR